MAEDPMPSSFEALQANLLSPMVLAFVLGAVATLVRSDLKIPDALYDSLAIYLLLAIGLKGGVALSEARLAEVALPALVTIALGAATPLWCVAILRRLGGLDRVNAAAIAAHYGSVSAVTFIACLAFLQQIGQPYEGFVPALVALLEVPGIVVALLLARRRGDAHWGATIRELLTGKSVVLLAGGLAIGWVTGRPGFAHVAPLFEGLFRGALVLFLLEMGLVAARRFRDLRRVGPFLIGFGLVMPVLHAALGVGLGTLAGLSVGGATVLGILAGSASYIAAPAAVRIALPEANPSLYLTASLAVTFPFNLAVGIPLAHAMARLAHGG
jgi:hypothetical protein